jgi:hypothetical protein
VVSLAQHLRLDQNSPEYDQFLSRAAHERFRDVKVDLDAILKSQSQPHGVPISAKELTAMTAMAPLFYPRPYLAFDALNPFQRFPLETQFALSNVMSMISLGFAKTLTIGLIDGRSVTYNVGQEPTASQPARQYPAQGEGS